MQPQIMLEDSFKSPLVSFDHPHSDYILPVFFTFSEHSSEEAENLSQKENIPSILPILHEINLVVLPKIVIPLILKHEQSVEIVQQAYDNDESIGIIPQNKNIFFSHGITATVLKILELPDKRKVAIIKGNTRFEVKKIIQEETKIFAKIKLLKEKLLDKKQPKVIALIDKINEVSQKMFSHLKDEVGGLEELQENMKKIKDDNFLINFLCFNLNTDTIQKQKLLAIDDVEERGLYLIEYLLKKQEMAHIQKEMHHKLYENIKKDQKDFLLKQQIKVLQKELGDQDEESEIEELKVLGSKKKWPEEVAEYFYKNLDKAERLHTHSSDYATYINHAELFLELPWQVYTKDNLDLVRAKKVLDKHHYGLDKVKERIIEYLAAVKLKKNMKGPILCLYGPPGVGKTSLGESIAKALNRKYVKVFLGGLQDEAEIRGHRKTYVAAMPGKIIQHINKAKASNPVMLLDEIDKVDSHFRGDPSSALLEVLDPEQNNTFVDNFLEVPYDLSQVLFITTANSLDTIPRPLRDRMEIIPVNGYTIEEKMFIAQKYLIPKQKKNHGLKFRDLTIDIKAIKKVIEEHTKESGVRELDRKLGKIVRKIAKNIVLEEEYSKKINTKHIHQLLGNATFDKEIYQHIDIPGVAIGLAWTPVGGDILFIESSLSQGKGKLTLSGQLGDIMKESAITALSYIKAYAEAYGIDNRVFQQYDLHIHVPAGAIPKDGPSAGITLFVSILSLYTQRKVKEKLAMTGEITLRGKILPVGGIQEKILAAKHAGINTILLSKKNEKDISEIKKEYIENININYIDSISELIALALQKNKEPNSKVWQFTK